LSDEIKMAQSLLPSSRQHIDAINISAEQLIIEDANTQVQVQLQK